MSFFSKLFGRKPAQPSPFDGLLDIQAFAERYASDLRAAFPDSEILLVPGGQQEARLDVVLPGEVKASLRLANSYQRYLNAPQALEDILADQVASVREIQRRLAGQDADEAEAVILPLVKTRAWLDTALAQAHSHQPGLEPFIVEALAGDLIVTYVEDSPATMSFLSPAEAAQRGLEGPALREHALQNLAARLPELEVGGGGGRYVARLDRNYDASMVLLFDVWGRDLPLQGEPVIGVPARDEVLICDSHDRESLEQLGSIVADIAHKSAYGLSSRLFVWRDGGLRAFEG